MNWRDWFSIGYGPAEFRQDRHVAWTILLTYAITRLPQIKSFTWEACKQDLLTVGTMVAVALLKSWLLRSNNDSGPKPPELGA